MNSPTPFSSSNDSADFPELLDEPESTAAREGLPAGFRMRATAHYVDQLETPPQPTLRPVAVSAIESDSPWEAPEYLVTSVRKHGVLEPLLVQHDPRGRQYRLIAGRNRLAAAHAAGLREVPCIVHTISDADAAELRTATRGTGRSELPLPQAAGGVATSFYPAHREIESALTSIESCSPMLNLSSTLVRHGAAQVIAAECRRAQRVLTAMTVLGTAVPIRRELLTAAELFARLRDAFTEEQRLIGAEPTVDMVADSQSALYGDAHLLMTALGGVLTALTAVGSDRPRALAFVATTSVPAGTITLELTDHSVIVPDAFVRSAFTSSWPVPGGDAVLLLLQAARWIVAAHGGSMWLASDATGTSVRLELPATIPARMAPARTATN